MAQVQNNMVHGVKPVLEFLRQMEPALYRETVKDLKDKADPLRAVVAQAFPDKPWDSAKPVNWTRYGRTSRGRKVNQTAGADFPKYDPKKVRAGVKIQVGGRKVRRTNSYPILRIKQTDAAGSVFDLAKNNASGTQAGQQFVRNLAKTGSPSRVMWKQVEKNYRLVEVAVMQVVDGIGKRFTAQIAAETNRRNAQSIRASKQARNALGQFGKTIGKVL